MEKIILDLCGGTGSWSRPYKEAGYDVRLVTLPETDVRDYEPPDKVYGILAAPPCTEFSIAKNHNLKRDFDRGMEIVNACLNIIEKTNPVFWALENPAGYLSLFLGNSVYSFQPYEYGDAWCKRTLLWGCFNIPKKTHTWEQCIKIPELYIRPGRKRPSIAFCHRITHQRYMPGIQDIDAQDDASFRAITPAGFAKAFFEANR